jgi:hypothetical protein
MAKRDMQDMRIRSVPKKLVYRLKAAIASQGWNLAEWFIIAAAKTADDYEQRIKKGDMS